MIKMELDALPEKNINGEKLEVRHLCNNQLCIEPEHLILGTRAENGEDQTKNGLQKGEKNNSVKITEELAKSIKLSKYIPNYSAVRETQSERAKRFKVSIATISNIDSGHTWGYLHFVDGTTSEKQRKLRKEKQRTRRRKLKETLWTDKQYEKAKEKLIDPNYTKIHDTKSYNNISCMEWIGGSKSGYGLMNIHGQTVYAHIIACAINNDNIIPDGFEAAHLCGFSFCVEPSHLSFKTHADNINDKAIHGTGRKISFEDIMKIRELYEENPIITYTEIANIFNISKYHVANIINNKTRVNG